MNRHFATIFNSLWYIVVFLLLQLATQIVVMLVSLIINPPEIFTESAILASMTPMNLIISTSLSAFLTILVFHYTNWYRLTFDYLHRRPYKLLVWCMVFALAALVPSMWLEEQMNVTMDEQYAQLFEKLMSHPAGYISISLLVPVAEEIVFRGALLHKLLEICQGGKYWVAIVISALVFGLIHGNQAQFIHAMLLGLVLGWLYYRTRSVIPGIAVHWVNNTVAFLVGSMVEGGQDMTVNELFGSDVVVYTVLAVSSVLTVTSLYIINKVAK